MSKYLSVLVALTVLLTLCSTLSAQLTPLEMTWELGQSAAQRQDWERATNLWRQLLAQREWRYPISREELTCSLANAYGQLLRFDDARQALRTGLLTHTDPRWVGRGYAQLAQLERTQGKREAFAVQLSALADEPQLALDVVQGYLQGGARIPGGYRPLHDALRAYVAAHPAHRFAAASVELEAGMMAAVGEPQAAFALLQAHADTQTVSALLLTAELSTRLGQPGRSMALLTDALPQAIAAEAERITEARDIAQRRAAALATLREDCTAALARLMDNPAAPPADLVNVLSHFAGQGEGATAVVAEVLQGELTRIPLHPAYATVRLHMARLLAKAGDLRSAQRWADTTLDAVLGTPEELSALIVLAEQLVILESPQAAAELFAQRLLYQPTPDATYVAYALAYYTQTEQVAQVERVLGLQEKAAPTSPHVLTTACWLVREALLGGDTVRAQRWITKLNALAPEHPSAVRARKLMRQYQANTKASAN